MLYPKITTTVQCLESLVGIRTYCGANQEYPFYIEDIEGVDIKTLASIAKGSNLNGKNFGNQLINSAAREMLADIEKMLNGGYRLKNMVNDMCSNCTLLQSYTQNTGIIVKNVIGTSYGILRITRLTVLANVTGTYTIRIDDGVTPIDYPVQIQAGMLMPIKLNYSTLEKQAKIFFTDTTVPLGQIICTKPSSCGCGGAQNDNNPIHIAGLSNGIETSNQYGFLPCAGVDCSYESLVCNLIKHAPNVFGVGLLYKVGEKFYAHKRASGRNNDTVSYNEEDDPKSESGRNYNILYLANLNGKADRVGIRRIVSEYLKNKRADRCIECTTLIGTAGVTG